MKLKLTAVLVAIFSCNLLFSQEYQLFYSKDTCYMKPITEIIRVEWVIIANKRGNLKKIKPVTIVYFRNEKVCDGPIFFYPEVYDRKFFIKRNPIDVIAYKTKDGNISIL